MTHPIHRVVAFQIVGPYTLRVEFDDHSVQLIDFQPVLAGELYGPLRELSLFNQVQIDPEVHTLVWPSGADFDPETLHDWPRYAEPMQAMARRWALTTR
ncbi:MAG: DUF2442 domain-containing protein [Candidatus Hydrogenedentes bacterium]|nr:DUF2442 domain-containing protein [Candidatus Hydrogenedentota bacterium]